MFSRKNTPEIFGLIKEQRMGELSKNFARRKTLKFTFSLWNIWYISLPWKSSWKNCPQSAAVCFYIELSQKSIKWKISQRCEKQWFFYQFFVTNHSRNILNQNSKLVLELKNRKMIFRSEKDASHSLQMKFLKFRQYLQNTSYIHHQRSQKRRRNSGKIL